MTCTDVTHEASLRPGSRPRVIEVSAGLRRVHARKAAGHEDLSIRQKNADKLDLAMRRCHVARGRPSPAARVEDLRGSQRNITQRFAAGDKHLAIEQTNCGVVCTRGMHVLCAGPYTGHRIVDL